MSGLLGGFRQDKKDLKNYQQAVKEIYAISNDRNNWDAGKIFVSDICVPDIEMDSLPFGSPFIKYKESDILEPMRNGDQNFVFSRLLYQPSNPDGWEHLYQKIERARYNSGMQLNCYNFNKIKGIILNAFAEKYLK